MQMCVCECKTQCESQNSILIMNLNRKTLHLHEVLLSVCLSVGECEFAHGRNDSLRTQTADCFDCQDPFKQTFAAFRTFI